MKQYQITFYPNKNAKISHVVYYREFETVKELKEWSNDLLHEASLYCRYTYLKITLTVFLENT